MEITDFWGKKNLECDFKDDVNFIIGKNGSGKTTFINLLINILTVDIKNIGESKFESVTINLSDGKKKEKIKVKKKFEDNNQKIIEFEIFNKSYPFSLPKSYDRHYNKMIQHRYMEEIQELKNIIDSVVSISSLSVYRLRNDDSYEVFERGERDILSPIDFRIQDIMHRLVKYQLELEKEANRISIELKDDVLLSTLYDGASISSENEFDAEKEKKELLKAYKHLNINNKVIEDKIDNHIKYIVSVMNDLESEKDQKKIEKLMPKFFASIESIRITRKVIERSIKAEKERDIIFSPIRNFIEILESFMSDKYFKITQNGLLIIKKDNDDEVSINELSSGEKQLIILLCEALLQKNSKNVYITDEPELSLHISWQRKIIPSIKKLNPKSQIIVATHSPEIISYNKNRVLLMKELFNE